MSNFVVQALTGGPLTLYGDGSQTRSFCYVDDEVAGLLGPADCRAAPGPVNIGNPHEVTMRELAELVVELTGSSSPITTGPIPPGREAIPSVDGRISPAPVSCSAGRRSPGCARGCSAPSTPSGSRWRPRAERHPSGDGAEDAVEER